MYKLKLPDSQSLELAVLSGLLHIDLSSFPKPAAVIVLASFGTSARMARHSIVTRHFLHSTARCQTGKQYISMDKSQLSSLPNASFLRRIVAGIYDLFLLFAVGFFYTAILMLVAHLIGADESSGLLLDSSGEQMTLTATSDYSPLLSGPLYNLGLYLSLVMFYVGFWHTRSATLGMQTWRTRLITLDGGKPGWKQLWIRALVGTFFIFGLPWSLIDKQNRTLHDLASGTRVVVLPKNTSGKK